MLQGFTNTVAGECKAGIVESSSAKDGYNKATGEGNNYGSSEEYVGEDKVHNEIKIKIHCLTQAGNQAVYKIEQVVL